MFFEIAVLKNFVKFHCKQMWWSSLRPFKTCKFAKKNSIADTLLKVYKIYQFIIFTEHLRATASGLYA